MATKTSSSPKRTSNRPSERALSILWQRTPAVADGLVTEDGRRLRVLYAGRPNSREGPDFVDARLAVESGEVITGDVELHVRAPDWYGHGHHSDPGYNGVVLHVVLLPRGHRDTRQQDGTTAPVASIEPLIAELEGAVQGTQQPPSGLQGIDDTALADMLDSGGDARFAARTQGMRLELREVSPDEVAHRALMEGLGYASNRRPFRELAVRVPFATAVGLRNESPATRLVALQALLVGTAGFLAHKDVAEAGMMKRLYRSLSNQMARTTHVKRRPPMTSSQWHTFRVRPSNHPVRRIMGASYLMDRYSAAGLVRGLEDDVRKLDGNRLRGRLEIKPFVGPERAGDLTVNVVLPLVSAMAEERADAALARRCMDVYSKFPKLGSNEVTREMARLLGEARVSDMVKGVRRQQGLIYLYKRMRGAGGEAVGSTEDSST